MFLPNRSKIHFPRFALDHELELVALRLRLEGAGIARSWRPEHEIRAAVARKHGVSSVRDRVVPDGLMGVATGKAMETVAIELELYAKNQKRWRRIFADYSTKKSLWGIWYVVRNTGVGRQLAKAARDTWQLRDGPNFFWSVLEEVMRDPLEAIAFSKEAQYRIRDLWTPDLREKPAHPPAQGMSRESEEKISENEKPTPENSSENPIAVA